MILFFVEFLAYFEIVRYDFLQTSQVFQKWMTFIEKKKDFLTDSIVLIKEKTLNTLSSFYQYPDRLFKTDWFPLYSWCTNSLDMPTTTNRPPQTAYLFLPQKIYNEEKSSGHFDLKTWLFNFNALG